MDHIAGLFFLKEETVPKVYRYTQEHREKERAYNFYICDRPRENQPYCADNHFFVKATIANYNLWTSAPANLKSLASVVTEI